MPESNNHKFNHLKVHTQYSICEGAIKIDSLKDFCKEKKIASVGLSDTANLCGCSGIFRKYIESWHTAYNWNANKL